MPPEMQALVEVVNTFGTWALFFLLYWDERKAHRATREELTSRLQQAQSDHMTDLKEIAGLRANLAGVQRIVTNYRAGESQETAQRPKV